MSRVEQSAARNQILEQPALCALLDRFEKQLFAGNQPRIEEFVGPDTPHRLIMLEELVHIQIEYQAKRGETVSPHWYLAQFPELAQDVECAGRLQQSCARLIATEIHPAVPGRKPNAKKVLIDGLTTANTKSLPACIDRYRIERVLGKGGFGVVYLAYDEELTRPVAVKVPHPDLIPRREDAEMYLAEARTVANLDHPHIVPVYDVGSTPEFPVYVVSKYVDGGDLAAALSQSRKSRREAAELVATIAEAVHYAHKQGLFHRDLKPGNILLDKAGRPYVVDFGLALRERDVGTGAGFVGTPAYMSPEQARGEGHRIDGRSDIFSLGVMLYEMLLGKRPFRGQNRQVLLEQISTLEAQPLRQVDDSLPKELERICLKALAKRAADRYTTALDFAEDLRAWLATATELEAEKSIPPAAAATVVTPVPATTLALGPKSDGRTIKIVPKGLRSFDEHDADFFLELLPGPRDREGLPDSIRFWKTRIEETSADKTFPVGLIYGPSGCGKSSLIKAGLLPRLSLHVHKVYVESSAGETESRLLHGLRHAYPGLPPHLNLKESVAALRRGEMLPKGAKVLIVLDQFEQWLHAHREAEDTELAHAIRQCDGVHVQCLVMVRDDFWMAASRFMRDVEIRLVEGHNSAAADLFPLRHAQRILAAFGRAFGALEDSPLAGQGDQLQFIEQAVAELAEDGKVVCVRLALFAEMMKDRPWTPAALKSIGGAQGVGVAFLEETFSSAAAHPEHRYHQHAARAVLKALLPEAGSDLKGHMRSSAELLAASGYKERPQDFDNVMRILDNEIRLITPTDPEGKDEAGALKDEAATAEDSSFIPHPSAFRCYQLAHDYLVASLRDWLTRKQRETRRGRAELLLAERASLWNAKPENRNLPSFREHLTIRWFTDRKTWTEPERKMMRRVARLHRRMAVSAVARLFCATLTAGFLRANYLVESLLTADVLEVPGIIEKLRPFRPLVNPLLRAACEKFADDSREKLNISLALRRVEGSQVEYLTQRLLKAEPDQFLVIRDALPVDEVATILESEISRQLTPDWHDPPLDPRWGNVDAGTRARIETAQGLLHERFVLCQRIPLAEWDGLAEEVRRAGYRPSRLRPFADDTAANEKKSVSVAAVWVRDGCEFRAAHGLSRGEIKARDAEQRAAGLLPADVAAYAVPNGEIRYAVLWVRRHGDAEDARLFAGVESAEAASILKLQDGFELSSIQQILDSNGSLLFSFIRRTPGQGVEASLEQSEQEYGNRVILGQTQYDLSISRAPKAPTNREYYTRLLNEAERSLAADSNDLAALLKRGEARGGLQLDALAVEDFTAALARKNEIRDDLYKPFHFRAVSHARLGNRQAAAEDLDEFAKIQPGSFAGYLAAIVAAWEGKVSGLDRLRESLTKHPVDPSWLYNSACAYAVASRAFAERDQPRSRELAGEAAVLLERAIAAGYTDYAAINKDYALESIRDTADFQRVLAPGRLDLSHSAVWQTNLEYESVELHGLKPADHLVRCRDLSAEGFRPVSIAGLVQPASTEAVAVVGSVWQRPRVADADKERLAERQTNAAIALVRLGHAEEVWPLFKHSADPRLRSMLIHQARPLGCDPATLIAKFRAETDVTARRALLLSLGEFPESQFPAADRKKLIGELQEIFREHPDPGLHAAASWVLHQWGHDGRLHKIEKPLMTGEIEGDRRWYVNGQGQTYAVVPAPGEFRMGSPISEAERYGGPTGPLEMPHRRRIAMAFAIATTEVTVDQFRRFRDAQFFEKDKSPTGAHPINSLTWFEAAAYCNWLSEKEGIPSSEWCYDPEQSFEPGMRLSKGLLTRSGYRLPTEAEWEYACRAGAVTSRYFGSTEKLLPRYCCYRNAQNNGMQVVGSLKPNDFGLFDMLGNASEWCQDQYQLYVASTDDASGRDLVAAEEEIGLSSSRTLRGGGFNFEPSSVRSAYRYPLGLNQTPLTSFGFRPARTLPDGSPTSP